MTSKHKGDNMACKSCKHWKKMNEESGTCCLNPPQVVVEHINVNPEGAIPYFLLTAVSRFPSTSKDTFCGHCEQ